MSEPYYAAAVAATHVIDGVTYIRLYAAVIHPDPGVDPEGLAIESARREMLPESEGFSDYHAIATPIDIAISASIEAEQTAVPNELRIIRIPH